MVSSKNYVNNKRVYLVVFLVIFLCGIAVSGTVFLEESEQVHEKQTLKGQEFTHQLQSVLEEYAGEMNAIVAFMRSSKGPVTQENFSRFIQSLTLTNFHIYFSQYVPASRLQEFEQQPRMWNQRPDFSVYPTDKGTEFLPIILGYPNSVPYGFNILSKGYPDIESVLLARNSRYIQLSKATTLPFQNDLPNQIKDTLVLRRAVYLPLDIRNLKMSDSIGFHGLVEIYFSIDDLIKQAAFDDGYDLEYRIGEVLSNGDLSWFVDSHDKESFNWKQGDYHSNSLHFAGKYWRVDIINHGYDLIKWTYITLPFISFSFLAVFLSWYVKKLTLAYRSVVKSINKSIEIDQLTGLLSRYQIQEELNKLICDAEKNHVQLAALCLDLDRFKTINDAFGHETGDQVLVKVAQRLTAILPENALVGRLGGDEFLVLLKEEDFQSDVSLKVLAKEIIYQLSQNYFVGGRSLNVGCSIGVALYPEFGLDTGTLVKHADMSVYEAKKSGRAMYHFYDGEMGKRFARNVRIETRLRQAIEDEGLEVHFQPKVDINSEQCVGMEALIRWHDEELGNVSPAEFIPIAEQTGIILALGEWVFEQTFKHILEWQEQGIKVPPIAINCSAVQIRRSDFLSQLLVLLDKYKIDPSLLELELTESILIDDAEYCADLLHQISRLGIKLAIDDFGTGYSSLSYLKDLPFDYVKIDQVFIRDITEDKNHAALTHAIITLSHNLNLTVIAEGITSLEQLIMLQELGCDIGQGYFFSKALGADSMAVDPMIVALNNQNADDM